MSTNVVKAIWGEFFLAKILQMGATNGKQKCDELPFTALIKIWTLVTDNDILEVITFKN